MTDFTSLASYGRMLSGTDSLPSGTAMLYNNPPTFTNSSQIVDKSYVDTVATSGAADAGIGTKGLVAVNAWGAAATSTDGSSVLYSVPHFGDFATSSQGTQTGVVTNTSGTIAASFIGSSTTYSVGGITSNGSS